MSQDFKDYYRILEITFQAEEPEIKSAYRKMARELHPDKHSDEADHYTALFQEVTEAYETLSDPYKKGLYDLKYRQIVLQEGPRYEYVADETPPDTRAYKHKYTYRNKRTFSFASIGALILLFFQVLRMLVNAAPIEDKHYYNSKGFGPLPPSAAYHSDVSKPAQVTDSLTIPFSNAPFMDKKRP